MTPRPPRPGHKSELEKMREKTRYDASPRIIGHAPYPLASLADGNRITGLAGGRILTTLIVKATGRQVPKNEPFLEITEPLTVEQLAELCFLDKRTIQRELDYMKKRKIIAVKVIKKGLYEFQPLFRTWHELPDYVPVPIAEPAAEEDELDGTEPDPEETRHVETRITKKPVRIAAGKHSRPVKVECGVSALQFLANIDAECSAVVKDGVLRVNLQCFEQAKSVTGQTNGINKLDLPPRQVCRDDTQKPIVGGKKVSGRSKGEIAHPRAAELVALFDPLLLRWSGKSLSGDPVMLLKACEAIGETPHDILVHDVVERSERPLKVSHVESLCREIAHNFEKNKDAPPRPKKYTREELNAMVERDRQARLAREKKRAS